MNEENDNGKRERDSETASEQERPTKSIKSSEEDEDSSALVTTNGESTNPSDPSDPSDPALPVQAKINNPANAEKAPEVEKKTVEDDPTPGKEGGGADPPPPAAAAPEKVEPAAAEKTEEATFVVDRTGDPPGEEPSATDLPAEETPPAPEAPAPPTAAPPGTAAPAPVDPTVQASIVNPTQIVEERGEIPALYVGKVIGKVRRVPALYHQCAMGSPKLSHDYCFTKI